MFAIATVAAAVAIAVGVVVVDDAEPSSVSLAQRRLTRQFAQNQRLCRLLRRVHLTGWEVGGDIEGKGG